MESNFCKPTILPPGTSEDLKALYKCSDATRCLTDVNIENKRIIDENKIIDKKFEDANTNYDNNLSNFKRDYDNWDKMTGNYANWESKKKELANERKDWNSCVTWNQVKNEQHDDWCRNDHGEGWYHSMSESGNTNGCGPFLHRGTCRRTNEKITDDLNTLGYSSKKPLFSIIKPSRDQYIRGQTLPLPEVTSINCCSNYIGESSGNVYDNAQTCSQEVDIKIKEYEDGSPSDSEETSSRIPIIPATSTSPFSREDSDEKKPSASEKDYKLEIGIAVLIILLLLISSSIAAVTIM